LALSPAPFANASFATALVMSRIAVVFFAARQPVLSTLGASRIATSHSRSSGGRTVTRNSAPPSASASSDLCRLA